MLRCQDEWVFATLNREWTSLAGRCEGLWCLRRSWIRWQSCVHTHAHTYTHWHIHRHKEKVTHTASGAGVRCVSSVRLILSLSYCSSHSYAVIIEFLSSFILILDGARVLCADVYFTAVVLKYLYSATISTTLCAYTTVCVVVTPARCVFKIRPHLFESPSSLSFHGISCSSSCEWLPVDPAKYSFSNGLWPC
jgi:hypothetical protein